jgi:hypothetical protein
MSKIRNTGLLVLTMSLAHVGCSSSKSSVEMSTSDVKEVEVPEVSVTAYDGVRFNGNGVVRTQYINNGPLPVMIEAVVSASAPRGEQSIVSNCQQGGFSLSLIDNYWTLYWHDSSQYQTVRAKNPVKIGQRTQLLGIIEEGKMELFVNGVSQGTTAISGHKPSGFPFYVGADPVYDSSFKYDPTLLELPFSGVIFQCSVSNDPSDIDAARSGRTNSNGERAEFSYLLVGPAGTTITDRSKNKNDGVLENGEWLPAN